jgi:hypothetical protein
MGTEPDGVVCRRMEFCGTDPVPVPVSIAQVAALKNHYQRLTKFKVSFSQAAKVKA